jgi:hypothetical protein
MDDQTQNNKAIPALLTDLQKTNLLADLGLDSLTPAKQAEVASKMIDTVMLRVFTRITPVLTDEDINMLEQLDQKDDSGVVVNQYLASKVPNLDSIVKEETENFKKEMQDSLSNMQSLAS